MTRAMNQARRRLIVGSILVVLGLVGPSGCRSDRQTIFTAPRSGMTPIDSSVTARKPLTDDEPRTVKSDSPSNRVDVPILSSD